MLLHQNASQPLQFIILMLAVGLGLKRRATGSLRFADGQKLDATTLPPEMNYKEK